MLSISLIRAWSVEWPLSIWTFFSQQSNHLTNKLQEWTHRTINNDYVSSFARLLEMSNECSIPVKNIKVL